MVNIGFLFFINICFLLFSTSHASLQEEDRVTGLYYTGASYQDPASHLPKGYVKDAIDDPLNAALRDTIDESYTKVVQVSFKDNRLFSLNQHRRVLSPLFYLVRRECETTNNAENLHKSIKHHMQTVWQQDKLRVPERDIDVFFKNMMPFTIKFLDIGWEQRAPAARGINPEGRIIELYYTGASYQDPELHLPKGYVKDAMDDKLNAALRDTIDESYTKVVQVSFKDNKLFSLNQHRRVLSPLFYLVRRECETTNNAENLHKSIKHHMQTVWQQDELRVPERDIDVFFKNMMLFTIKFLNIGREQRAPAERGARGLIEDNLKKVLLKISVNFDPHSETSLEALYNSKYTADLYVKTKGFGKSYEINRDTLFPLSIEVPLEGEGSLQALLFSTWTPYKLVESIGGAIIDNSTELENRGRCFKSMKVKLSLGSSALRVVDGHVIKTGSNQKRPFLATCVVENYEEV